MGFHRTSPPTKHEFALIEAGYKWTATVNLVPRGTARPKAFGMPVTYDTLGAHLHQSKNTHLIVRGQLTINGTGKLPKLITLNAGTFGTHDKEAPVEPEHEYQGQAGSFGCQFIEAHHTLSPATAKRFAGRLGALEWRDDGEGITQVEWLEREGVEGLTRPPPGRVPREVLKLLYHNGSTN